MGLLHSLQWGRMANEALNHKPCYGLIEDALITARDHDPTLCVHALGSLTTSSCIVNLVDEEARMSF